MRKIVFALVTLIALCFFAPSIAMRKDISKTQSQNSAGLTLGYHRADAYERGDATNVTKILADQAGKKGDWVRTINKICLSFVNIIAVCFLIFVALANILQYDIQKYAIKAIIPRLVGAVIAANLVMPIIVFASRLVDNLQSISIFQPLGAGGWFMFVFGDNIWQTIVSALLQVGAGLVAAIFTGGMSWVAQVVIFCVVVLFIILAVLLLSLIFAFRTYIVLLCAAVAPLAIICYALPQTSKLCERWLKILYPWLILPVLTNFILRTTSLLPAGSEMTVGSGTGPLTNIIGFFFPLMFRILVLVLVIRLPFKLESDIGGLIATGGKWLGSNAWKWGVGYGMGAGAYQGKKRSGTLKQKEFGALIDKEMTRRPGLTREQAEANVRLGLAPAQQNRLDRLNAGIRRFGFLEKWNPYGISGALQERGELLDKNIKKAYYRNNVITEQALGEEGWLKHQQEIQDADFSKLYTTSDVQANMRGNYRRLVRGWQAYRRASAGVGLSDEQAADEVEEMLRRLDTEQAAAIDYLDNFRECIGTGDNEVTVQGLSNVLSGFNRLQYTAASEIRGQGRTGAATFAADRNSRVNRCSRDMVASGSPGEQNDDQSTHHDTEATTEVREDGQQPERQTESSSKTEELLQSIRDLIKEQKGNKPSQMLVSNLAAARASIEQMDHDSLATTYSQSDQLLRNIETTLRMKMPFEIARQIVRRARASGGLIDQNDLAGNDSELSELLQRHNVDQNSLSNDSGLTDLINKYNAVRTVQIGARSLNENASSSTANAEKISSKVSNGADPAQVQQSIQDAVDTIEGESLGRSISPESVSQAKQYIGSIIGRSGETITLDDAERLASGSELFFTRDRSGKVTTIEDPAQLRVRTTIKQERDIETLDLGSHTEELRRKIEQRKQSGQELITSEETVRLSNKISAVVEPHMELRYSEQWSGQADHIKDQIIGDITNTVKNALVGLPEGTSQAIEQTSAGIGAMTLAEKMFQSRIGK